ncbi:MAG: hypothetical protein AB8F94_21745 [Saprospiraceae bacterium]
MATIKTKSVRNGLPIFVLTTLFIFTTFFAKADVEYSTPLHGKEFKMGNRIEWKTAYEMDTKMFIVEKSDDGINFYMEREIQAAGISNKEKGYRFMDVGNNNETTFYRLKLVDEDETESYSAIAMVKKTQSNNFQIVRMSNTSAIKTFEVTLDALSEKELTFSLEKFNGEKVFSTKKPLINGLNEIEINLEDELPGKYKLVFVVEGEVEEIILRKVEGEETQKENVAVKRKGSKKG